MVLARVQMGRDQMNDRTIRRFTACLDDHDMTILGKARPAMPG